MFPKLQVEGYNVAYVGNIAFEADEADLRELLKGCDITKVRRHTDKVTGKFKGYAHVHFADEDSLDRYYLVIAICPSSNLITQHAPRDFVTCALSML